MTDKLTRIEDGGGSAALAAPTGLDFSAIDVSDLKRKFASIASFQSLVRECTTEGVDYGRIPGAGDKPTLLKPGAEKIAKLLNCYDEYEIVQSVEDWSRPLFRYLIRCTLIEMSTGTKVSSGLGECNSMESKYRWRWVREAEIPSSLPKDTLTKKDSKRSVFEFEFALNKRETTGKYGKPESYWAAFDAAIKSGTAVKKQKETSTKKVLWGFEITLGETLFRIPNDAVYDQINTLLKMAKKRALVDASLSAGRLSDLFTQDLEDLQASADRVSAATEPEEHPSSSPSAPKTPPKPEASKPEHHEDYPPDNNGDHPDAPPDDEPSEQKDTDRRVSADRLTEISKLFVDLQKSGTSATKIMDYLYKNVDARFGRKFAAFDELTEIEAEFVETQLRDWIAEKKRRAAAPKGESK